MFRIVCFVNDNKLGDALAALAGKAHSMEVPQHITNVIPAKGGKLKQEHAGGSLAEKLKSAVLKMDKGTATTTTKLKALITKLGGSSTGAGSYIKGLIEDKVLSRTGRGEYTVNS